VLPRQAGEGTGETGTPGGECSNAGDGEEVDGGDGEDYDTGSKRPRYQSARVLACARDELACPVKPYLNPKPQNPKPQNPKP
jgi:hypothetical protein